MIKKISLYLFSAILLTAVCACNSDKKDEAYEEMLSGSARVINFTLKKNNNVLANLDSVFFTIDMDGYRIYNADSLPFGTNVTKIVPKISLDKSSVVELIVSGAKLQKDTTFNYLAHPDDTIDFSGNVVLRVVSADAVTERKYDVSVNVHQTKPDSLYWNQIARRDLPTTIANPTEQKAVEYNGQALCLAGGNGSYTIATIDNPALDSWEISDVTFDFTPNVNSLTAAENALYILDTDGNLYSSVDGNAWTACGVKWTTILGKYQSNVMGIEQRDGAYYHTAYPTAIYSEAVADDFPVSGISPLITFTTEWSDTPQAIIAGGRTASGALSNITWGFDGSQWAALNTTDLPALEDITFFPYFCYKTHTSNWTVTKHTTWIAMGGRGADGEMSRNVYISFDSGLHWHLGDEVMQLPEYIPSFAEAQALVFSETLHTRSSSAWQSYPSLPIPMWWAIADAEISRATKPITEWECPYIYLFGGVDAQGNLQNSVWRGVINRLTFKPII